MKRALVVVAILTGLALPSHAIMYHTNTGSFVAANLSEDYTNFTWHFSGYDDEVFSLGWDVNVSNVAVRFSYPKAGTVYLEYTNFTMAGLTAASATVIRTNLTLTAGPYYTEILGYDPGDWSTGPARVIAKGKSIMHYSLFNSTNFATNIYSPAGDITAVTVSGGLLTGGGASGSVDIGLTVGAVTNAMSNEIASVSNNLAAMYAAGMAH